MAGSQAQKSATKEAVPAFPYFNRLPWEIRRMVWEQALPPPIPQVLIYKPTTFPRWDPETNDWDATDGAPTTPIVPPAVLHATQESRAFALEHVLIRKVKKVCTRSSGMSAYHRIVCRPFNRDTDALFVHEDHFKSFHRVYMELTPSAARHVAFDIDIYHDPDWTLRGIPRWYQFTREMTEKCHGLRSVSFVGLARCDGRLHTEAAGSREPRGCYRAVPDAVAVAWQEDLGESLRDEFTHTRPDGSRWVARVGSNAVCGLPVEDDDERLLECSQVVLQRLNASNVSMDWSEWFSGQLLAAWEIWT